MILMMGRFEIDPQKRSGFLMFAKGLITRQQAAPGCLGCGIFEDVLGPNSFAIIEQWETREAMEVFMETKTFMNDDSYLSFFMIGQPRYDEYEF